MTHQGRKAKPLSEATGSYHVCGRCNLDSDSLPGRRFHQLTCALARGEWLCNGCRRAHQAACPICKPLCAGSTRAAV